MGDVSESNLLTLKVGRLAYRLLGWPDYAIAGPTLKSCTGERESFQEMLTAAPGFEIAYLHIDADWEESVKT